jgi:hypothetical protein
MVLYTYPVDRLPIPTFIRPDCMTVAAHDFTLSYFGQDRLHWCTVRDQASYGSDLKRSVDMVELKCYWVSAISAVLAAVSQFDLINDILPIFSGC